MNNDRRKRIRKVLAELEGINLSDVTEQVRELADEENEAAEGMEENFPGTARAETSREAADLLAEAADGLEAFSLEDIFGQIDSSQEL